MTLSNVLAYLAQVAVIVLVCAGLPRALRLRAPVVQYAFWRVVLLVCLALPLIQPWRQLTASFEAFALGSVAPSSVPFVNKIATAASSRPVYALNFNPLFVGAIVVAAGCALRLLWMIAGIAWLRSLRHAHGTEPAQGFEDLSATIGVSAPILWSPKVRHPVTFGVRRPVVLLPVALKSVDLGAQRAVVAHELHHVVRRDWAWLLTEEILRAVFWFHPAMWWLISRIQLARETVVDELSILVTNARRTYLDALLAFADDTGLGSPAFSARRHLFHRVMLLSKEGEMSSLRVAVGSGLLVVALGAGTWAAANAFPLYADPVAQTPTPPRDPRTPPRGGVSAQAYHRQAVEIWEKSRAASLAPEAQLDLVRQGIGLEDKALAINPDYVEAMTYKNIFLRLEANLTPDPAKQRELLEQANALRNRAIEIRKTQPYVPGPGEPPPPPPPPPSGPRRAPITLSLDNAQLPTVLNFFGQAAGLRVVADPSLSGLVTFQAVNVPWDEALRQILQPHGLAFEIGDSTLTVRRLASPPPPLAQPTAQTSPTPRFMPPPPPQPPMLVTASDGPTSVSVQTPAAPMAAPMSAAFQRAVEMQQPLRVGGDIKSPVKIRDVKPVYPAEARGAGVQGVVVLEVLIDASGDVADARVLRSIPLLDEAALGAVQQWRFTPTLLNGEPRSLLMTVTVNFRLP